MTLDLDRAVLLPVDMQQAFDAPSWPRRWNADADAAHVATLAFEFCRTLSTAELTPLPFAGEGGAYCAAMGG